MTGARVGFRPRVKNQDLDLATSLPQIQLKFGVPVRGGANDEAGLGDEFWMFRQKVVRCRVEALELCMRSAVPRHYRLPGARIQRATRRVARVDCRIARG